MNNAAFEALTRKPLRPNLTGQRWPKLMLPFMGEIALGNMTQFRFAILADPINGGVFVAVEGKGAYGFPFGVMADYVEEKLDVLDADAANIADLINAQSNDPRWAMPEQGRYESAFCMRGQE